MNQRFGVREHQVRAERRLKKVFDYTLGFQLKAGFQALCEHLRYMGMLRGMISSELVLDKSLLPERVRIVDPASLKWYEKKPGEYKPVQVIPGSSDEVSLDYPTFFTSFFRRNPAAIYPYSPFVKAGFAGSWSRSGFCDQAGCARRRSPSGRAYR